MHADAFLREAAAVAKGIDRDVLEKMADELDELRARQGRLYLLGLGGSAANCSHAAADFRKLCGIKAQAPTDNVAEFSARANDEGFATVFSEWLETSAAGIGDAVLIMSVGGGTDEVSLPISRALGYAVTNGMRILGIVGPRGGYTAAMGDVVLRIPDVNPKHVTPHTEAFQAVVWHALVSHPLLQRKATKW